MEGIWVLKLPVFVYARENAFAHARVIRYSLVTNADSLGSTQRRWNDKWCHSSLSVATLVSVRRLLHEWNRAATTRHVDVLMLAQLSRIWHHRAQPDWGTIRSASLIPVVSRFGHCVSLLHDLRRLRQIRRVQHQAEKNILRW